MDKDQDLGAAKAASAEERLRWFEAAHKLIANSEAFIHSADGGPFFIMAGQTPDGTPALSLNMNDAFRWGCADAESFEYMDAPLLWEIAKRDGWGGLVKWVQERRTQIGDPCDTEQRHTKDALRVLAERDAARLMLREARSALAGLSPREPHAGRLAKLLSRIDAVLLGDASGNAPKGAPK